MRCKSWRPRRLQADMGVPGKDRALWEPCRSKQVVAGTLRCEQCWELLASCPDRRVRRALAAERPLPESVLARLALDSDIAVVEAATGVDMMSLMFAERQQQQGEGEQW